MNLNEPSRASTSRLLTLAVWPLLFLAAAALTALEPVRARPQSQEPSWKEAPPPAAETPAGNGPASEAAGEWFWGVSLGVESARRPSPPRSLAFDHSLFGSEPGELDSLYQRSAAPSLEASMGYQVPGPFAIAVALSRSSHDMDVDVAAQLPHPFFFSRPRSVEGTVAAAREQLSLHVSAMWRVREGRKIELAFFGGPSWFEFEQEVLAGLRFESEYPYDQATLTDGEVQLHSSGTAGYHAGAEIAWWFLRRAGILGTVRHVKGPDEFELPNGTRLDVDAGGLQVLIGIRYRF
jgi:hypothetical protein